MRKKGRWKFSDAAGITGKTHMLPLIEILRPRQWLKNGLVLVGLLFALPDANQTIDIRDSVLKCLVAFGLFCVVSSVIYIINDLHDADEDREHPQKKTRPVAAGRMSARAAATEGFVLLALSALTTPIVGKHFTFCIAVYFTMQIIYTFALKRVVLVDVFVIAAGFVLRVFAGTVAAWVRASPWLLLCTFAVALFIALCKRYDERVSLGDEAVKHRKVLAQYDPRFLSHIITATAALTIICYAIYTLSPQTVAKFGHDRLVATVPFVVFGIYRYAYLVFSAGQGGRPERIVTTDIPTIANFLLYVAACVAVLAL